MAKTPSQLKQRLKVMESVLTWEGRIDNSRVRNLFQVSGLQASRLLSELRKKVGDGLRWDGQARAYLPRSTLKRESTTFQEYLGLTWPIANPDPVVEEARIVLGEPNSSVYADIHSSCRGMWGVDVSYESMTHPEGRLRRIHPHTIVHVGRRLHVRAWCAQNQDFRDFVLARIRSSEPTLEPCPVEKSEDKAWEKYVTIKLEAHQSLDDARQRVIRNENFRGMASTVLKTRACLVAYVIQEVRAALKPDSQLPPDFQLQVANLNQISPYLFDLKPS